MKMIGVMSLQEDRKLVRELFEQYSVQIFSEIDVQGHTLAEIERYGWWPIKKDAPYYSTLCFAIIQDAYAEALMEGIAAHQQENPAEHPVRAFQVDVERLL